MKWMAVLVLMAACSDGAMTLDEYPAARLDVGCEYLIRCGVTSSLDKCHETRAAPYFDPDLLAAVDSGGVRWHGDAAEDCLERLEHASCDRTSESYRHLGCERLFSGALAKGEACTTSVECISRECWTEGCTDACCVGYCTGDIEPAIGEIGEPCRLSGCVAGARCEDSVCVSLFSEGEACTYDFAGECGYGLACQDRVCRPLALSGDRCSTSDDCTLIGDTCGPSGVCGPSGHHGDPCYEDSHCVSDHVCGAALYCVPGPRIGEPCTTTFTGIDRCYDAGTYCDPDTNICTLFEPSVEPTCVTP